MKVSYWLKFKVLLFKVLYYSNIVHFVTPQGLKSNDLMVLLQGLANRVYNTTPFAWQESLRIVTNSYLDFASNIKACVLGYRKHKHSL